MLAEFSITPLDKGGKQLSEYVAKSLEIIRQSGLKYELHAMGTIVEGEPEAVFALIQTCHMNMRQYSGRVSTSIKIDDKVGVTGALEGKVAAVKERLG
ncbi:MTH1187 family thiamine-binding protein [Chrysiogenes arsenatis]|uniref:MTH1187 family thiamine-binding protein n=1 Tax=Chrysiogenes arsenatis TaxID=309797 RepID=UPI000407B56E|nr:MTH1187 family thiamine-binding protein [Chrysiogenes arsenatis]